MIEPRFPHISTRWLSGVMCAALLGTVGCGGSGETRSSDETFFQPVKSLEQKKPAEAKNLAAPSGMAENKVVEEKKVLPPVKSSAITRADSLVKSQAEQERRLDELAAQLKALESGRRGEAAVTSPGAVQKPANETAAEKSPRATSSPTFAKAVELFDGREYQSARAAFGELMKGPLSPLERSECAYYAGMCGFRLGKFDEAVSWLKKVSAEIPRKWMESLFTMGLSYKHLGMGEQAKAMFERVIRESPDSDFAADAREELKGLAR
jgi:TolA-binding protein